MALSRWLAPVVASWALPAHWKKLIWPHPAVPLNQSGVSPWRERPLFSRVIMCKATVWRIHALARLFDGRAADVQSGYPGQVIARHTNPSNAAPPNRVMPAPVPCRPRAPLAPRSARASPTPARCNSAVPTKTPDA